MAREDLHFRLRIPEALKAKVEEAAAEHHRSMTAEIVARLEFSFGRDQEPSFEINDLQASFIEALERENEALRRVAAISEPFLHQCAIALGAAAEGDDTELRKLIEREKQHSILKRLAPAPTSEDAD